jgi:hypothetical protein
VFELRAMFEQLSRSKHGYTTMSIGKASRTNQLVVISDQPGGWMLFPWGGGEGSGLH